MRDNFDKKSDQNFSHTPSSQTNLYDHLQQNKMTNFSNVNCETCMCIIPIYFCVDFFSSKMKSTRRIRDSSYCSNN